MLAAVVGMTCGWKGDSLAGMKARLSLGLEHIESFLMLAGPFPSYAMRLEGPLMGLKPVRDGSRVCSIVSAGVMNGRSGRWKLSRACCGERGRCSKTTSLLSSTNAVLSFGY